MVSGPTPPGTGVIWPATSLTASKSTSPTRPASVRLMPTSITTAPGLTMSAVTNFARPMATIEDVGLPRHRGQVAVRLWQTVTVALAPPGRVVSHEHDRHRLAHDVAAAHDHDVLAPAILIPLRCSSCWMPCGVQGRNRGRPWTIRPTFSGWKASTSFSGLTASSTRVSSIWPRQRQLDQDAVDGPVAVEPLDQPSSSASLVVFGGRRCSWLLDARLLAGLLLVPHVDLAGAVFADQNRRQTRDGFRSGPQTRSRRRSIPLANLLGNRLPSSSVAVIVLSSFVRSRSSGR